MKLTVTRTLNRTVFRELPRDLLAVVLLVLATDALVSVTEVWPVLRVIVGLPVLFFLPGYVLMAVLFPGAGSGWTLSEVHTRRPGDGGPTLSTRFALSFGLSVAIIPVLSILLALSPVGYGREAMLLLLTGFVLVGAVVGATRRLRLPPERRFHVPARTWLEDLLGFLTRGRTRLGTTVNLLLVLAAVLAATGFAYGVLVPPAHSNYTDFMLLTRAPDGQYVSSGYPTNFTRGQGQEVVFGVANHRAVPTHYTVVVELQRVRGQGDSLEVVERTELGRYQNTVQPGETWYRPHQVTPTLAGNDLRLVYYLYRGAAPTTPSMDTADDHLHLWINVSL